MNETDPRESRLRRLREVPPSGSLTLDKLWLWQRLGLVLAMMLAVLIAFLTLTPIPQRATPINGLDKLYHFVAFGALIFPLILTDSRRWRWAVPLVCAFGGLIELIQPSVGRSAEWLDFGADVSGVLAGAALAEILHDRIQAAFFDNQQPDPGIDLQAEEERRMEEMRAELMDDLRTVLREELASSATPVSGAESLPEIRSEDDLQRPLRAIK